MKTLFLPEATNTTVFAVVGNLLPIAIVTITLALVCYTIGVWAEHRAGVLKNGTRLCSGWVWCLTRRARRSWDRLQSKTAAVVPACTA